MAENPLHAKKKSVDEESLSQIKDDLLEEYVPKYPHSSWQSSRTATAQALSRSKSHSSHPSTYLEQERQKEPSMIEFMQSMSDKLDSNQRAIYESIDENRKHLSKAIINETQKLSKTIEENQKHNDNRFQKLEKRMDRIESSERHHSRTNSSPVDKDTPLVHGQIFKLNQDLLGKWDPDKEPTYAFTSNILQAKAVYGDKAVVAAIPIALDGSAMKWFRSLRLTELADPNMETVDGWVRLLERAFPIDRIETRKKAQRRKYDPTTGETIRTYVWDKIELIKATERHIREDVIVEELWLGLPSELRMLLDENQMLRLPIEEFTVALQSKEKSFVESLRRSEKKHTQRQKQSNSWTDTKYKKPQSPTTSSTNLNSTKADSKNSISEEKRSWRKDGNGKWLTRPCRHCNEWHMDYDCKKKPANYYLTDQVVEPGDVSSEETSSSSSESEHETRQSYHSTTNGYRKVFDKDPMILKDAAKIPIVELPKASLIGTGLSYLSAEPCPIRAALGSPPDDSNPLICGVIDSGGACIIAKSNVPKDTIIHKSPTKPTFQGIGGSTTETLGYAVIPTFLPNRAAISQDKRSAKILMLHIEYQIVDECKTGFLIGRDASKAYSMDIEESTASVIINTKEKAPFRIPIMEASRLAVKHHDSRVFLDKDIHVKPRSDVWLNIRFKQTHDGSNLLFKPRRIINEVEGSYGSACFAIFSDRTSRMMFSNPSSRPIKLSKNELIGTFEPLGPNSPFLYFNQTHTFTNKGVQEEKHDPVDDPIDVPIDDPVDDPVDVHVDDPVTDTTDAHHPVTYHETNEEMVDPFGLSDESSNEEESENKEQDEIFEKEDLAWDINPKLKLRWKIRMLELLRKKKSAFSGHEERLGKVNRWKMHIGADISKIKSSSAYRASPRKRALIREAIEKLKRMEIIQKSSSQIASPVVIVWQKGKPRFCVDLREVNAQTPMDRYSIPHQDDIFMSLSGCLFFTLLDANKGYHQFELDEESKPLTAFITQEHGLWEFIRVPFGLKNAPAFFQRCIDEMISKYRWDFVLAYLDDIIIFSKTYEQHLEHVEKVLDTLSTAGLTLSEKKCHFAYKNIELLGRKVSRFGLSTQKQKVEAIMKLEFPRTVQDAYVVLGEFGYHRGFIDEYAIIAGPLTEGLGLTKEEKEKFKSTGDLPDQKKISKAMAKKPFERTQEREAAFQALKIALSNAPVLLHPDFSKPFFLYVDACRKGIAAGLYQVGPDKKEHPILFISRTLKPAEKNYAATELECLAIVWALKKLEHYVDGAQLTLITDHSALKWIWSIKETVNQRLFRWSLLLNPLKDKISIVHRPGRMHANADALSRHPTPAYLVTLINISDEWKERLQRGYSKDRHFRKIWKELRTQKEAENEIDDSEPEVDGKEEMENAKTRRNHIPGTFSIINSLLYLTEKSKTKANLRLCIPFFLIPEVLKIIHAAGHLGIRKTFQNVEARYYFPGMSKMIKNFVNNCIHCQTSKPSTERKAGHLQPVESPSIPHHTISIDFITGLPKSNGYDALLTITDKFAKTVKLIACRETTTAQETACLYLEHAYTSFGLPSKIISDRDTRFTSSFWQELCKQLKIPLGLTTAYHPSADGQAERTNQTVENSLRCLISDDLSKYDTWTSYLPILEHELNSTPQETTTLSPNELRFVIPPRSIPDVLNMPESKNTSVQELTEDLLNRRDEARTAIQIAQEVQRNRVNKKKTNKEFQEGDLVLLKFNRFGLGYKPPKEHRNKLGPNSTPLRIVKKLSPLAYKVALPPNSKMHDVVSIIHLKRFHGKDTGEIRPLPITQDGLEEWEVEAIEGERIVKGRKEYLVRWKGYNDDERSWEPVQHLENAPEILLEWKAKHVDSSKDAMRKKPLSALFPLKEGSS
jgi:hypothetical protein